MRRIWLLGLAVVVACAVLAAPAAGAVRFQRLDGFSAPGTPDRLNKVGVLKVGPRKAPNVLILNPGTSASSAYFAPLAKTVAKRAKGWQVWAVERRENLLEDHSVADRVKAGRANGKAAVRVLPRLSHRQQHHRPLRRPVADVAFPAVGYARGGRGPGPRGPPGEAAAVGRSCVGGHSLGGSITTAYATWDFNGRPGARGLAGLVFIDGGSGPTPVTPEQANQSLQDIEADGPWLAFGGIPAPFAGLFNIVGRDCSLEGAERARRATRLAAPARRT